MGWPLERIMAGKLRGVTRPLAYLDRRGVRAFRRWFGPLYPPYLGLAALFGFFAFIGFYAIGFQLLPPLLTAVAIVGGGGTGLLLVFADRTLAPLPSDATDDEAIAFNRRTRLAMLLLLLGMIAIFATFVTGGSPFSYEAGGFVLLGFAVSAIWFFLSTQALPCKTCGAVTMFRMYRNRLVCTRCGGLAGR